MNHRFFALLFCLGWIAASSAAWTQQGGWQVTFSSGEKKHDVDIAALHGDSLLLSVNGEMDMAPLDSIAEICHRDGGRWREGLLIGGGVGFLIGLAAPFPFERGDDPARQLITAAITGAGMVAGTIAGAFVPTYLVHDFSSMDRAEQLRIIEGVLEERRKDSLNAIFAPNNIYLEGGGNGIFYSLNYERLFTRNCALRMGLEYVPKRGVIAPLMVNWLFFNGEPRLEVGAGVVMTTIGDTPTHPAIHIGYRYQPLTKRIMLRAGLTAFLWEPVDSDSIFLHAFPAGLSVGATF